MHFDGLGDDGLGSGTPNPSLGTGSSHGPPSSRSPSNVPPAVPPAEQPAEQAQAPAPPLGIGPNRTEDGSQTSGDRSRSGQPSTHSASSASSPQTHSEEQGTSHGVLGMVPNSSTHRQSPSVDHHAVDDESRDEVAPLRPAESRFRPEVKITYSGRRRSVEPSVTPETRSRTSSRERRARTPLPPGSLKGKLPLDLLDPDTSKAALSRAGSPLRSIGMVPNK